MCVISRGGCTVCLLDTQDDGALIVLHFVCVGTDLAASLKTATSRCLAHRDISWSSGNSYQGGTAVRVTHTAQKAVDIRLYPAFIQW